MNSGNTSHNLFLQARSTYWGALLITIAVIITYWQVWEFDFIRLDDPAYVFDTCRKINNPDNQVLWIFRFHQGDGKYFQPLTLLSHIVDCRLFGLHAGLHHTTNLLLHVFNSLLVFAFLNCISTGFRKNLIIALLFAVHPMNVESVAWISERKNLLSSFFFFLALIAYCRYTRNTSRPKYLTVMFLFTLGLLTKPMLVTLPAVLLLLDWWPLNRIALPQTIFQEQACAIQPEDNKKLRPIYILQEKMPLLFLSLLFFCLTLYSAQGNPHLVPENHHSIPFRLANAVLSLAGYVEKLFWPVNLSFFYPYPETIVPWQFIGVAAVLFIFTIFCYRKRNTLPYLLTGWLWFLITISPVAGIFQAGLWPALADRWVYIPALGIFLMTVFSLERLFFALSLQRKNIFLFAVFCILTFMVLSWNQVRYWRDSTAMYEHTLKTTTGNFLAHNNLGIILLESGKIDPAIAQFQNALRIKPHYLEAKLNLANALIHQKNFPEALRLYQEVEKRLPGSETLRNNMGIAYLQLGNAGSAIQYFTKAILLKPDYADAYNNLGTAFWETGRKQKSLVLFQKALAIDPDNKKAYRNMIRLTSELKKDNQRLRQLARQSRPSEDDPAFFLRLGRLYQQNNQIDQAFRYYQKALDLKPGWIDARKNLAVVLAMKGNYEAAFSILQKISRQNPGDQDAYYYMASIRSRQNRVIEAVQLLQQAIEAGFSDWDNIRNNSNLNTIRNHARFKDLLARHQPAPDK